ncbi:MAG: zinc ribbon domain-containing protein [Acidimicrobiales bacterium]
MSDSTPCPSCGADVPAGAAFCTSCGTRLGEPAPPPAPGPDPTIASGPTPQDPTVVAAPPPPAPGPWTPPGDAGPAPAPRLPGACGPHRRRARRPPHPGRHRRAHRPRRAAGRRRLAHRTAHHPRRGAGLRRPADTPAWGAPVGAPAWDAGRHRSGHRRRSRPLGPRWHRRRRRRRPDHPRRVLRLGHLGPSGDTVTDSAWSLTSGDGFLKSNDPYLLLGLGVAAVVIGLLLFVGTLRPLVRIAAIVVGVAIVATAALNWSSIASFVTDNFASDFEAKTAIGFYLVIAGGIVTAIAALLPAKSS